MSQYWIKASIQFVLYSQVSLIICNHNRKLFLQTNQNWMRFNYLKNNVPFYDYGDTNLVCHMVINNIFLHILTYIEYLWLVRYSNHGNHYTTLGRHSCDPLTQSINNFYLLKVVLIRMLFLKMFISVHVWFQPLNILSFISFCLFVWVYEWVISLF